MTRWSNKLIGINLIGKPKEHVCGQVRGSSNVQIPKGIGICDSSEVESSIMIRFEMNVVNFASRVPICLVHVDTIARTVSVYYILAILFIIKSGFENRIPWYFFRSFVGITV